MPKLIDESLYSSRDIAKAHQMALVFLTQGFVVVGDFSVLGLKDKKGPFWEIRLVKANPKLMREIKSFVLGFTKAEKDLRKACSWKPKRIKGKYGQGYAAAIRHLVDE